MKTRILLTAIASCMFTALMAQTPAPAADAAQEKPKTPMTAEEKATKRVDGMKENLALDSKQERKMYNVMLTYYQKMDAIMEQRKALEAKTISTQNDREEGVSSILTEEQKAKYDEMQAKINARKGRQGGARQGDMGPGGRGPAVPSSRPAPAPAK